MAAIDATISGLGKREFVLRRAGKDQPEVFTTRWAMSYLRGPMTRDQIAQITVRRRTCRGRRCLARTHQVRSAGLPAQPDAAPAAATAAVRGTGGRPRSTTAAPVTARR